MKKWLVTPVAAMMLIGLGACNNASDEAVVKTKAGDITKEELYNEMKDRQGDQVVRELVYEKVLSDKYKVSDKDVNKKVKELKSELGDNYQTALAQYGYKDEADLKKSLKLSMLQEKAALKTVKASDAEVKKYYDEEYKTDIKARHILVKDEKTAKDVKKKLEAGDKFEDLAKKYSTDEGTKAKGGDLGWFGAGKMLPAFEEAAYKLDVNQISDPVKTDYGYHIIQVTDKKKKEPFEKVKDEMEYQVKLSKLDNEKVQAAVNKEIKAADIKVEDKDFKDMFK